MTRSIRIVGVLLILTMVSAACTDEEPAIGGSTTTTSATPTTTTTPEEPPVTLEEVRRATVAVATINLEERRQGIGSGSIVDDSGLILTNAHVADPTAPGLGSLYGLFGPAARLPVDEIYVGIYVAEDMEPDFRYRAEVLVSDGWLDLVVLKVTAMADGSALPTDFRFSDVITLGDSDNVQGGDAITVVGFPTVGGSTITTTRGIVGGFRADNKIDGLNRGWIKTDAQVDRGNSGGVAVDADGRLIGIPTRGTDRAQDLRPVNLAKPLIEDALAGMRYVQATGLVLSSGAESLSLRGWNGQEGVDTCPDSTAVSTGARLLEAGFEYDGFSDGLDVGAVLLDSRGDDIAWQVSAYEGWGLGESGLCWVVPMQKPDRSAFADGTYELSVYAGETMRRIATHTVIVGGSGGGGETSGEGVEVWVRLINTLTEEILEGGVFVLTAGTDAGAWLQMVRETPEDEVDWSSFVAWGVTSTDDDGYVMLSDRLVPGTPYTLAVNVTTDGYPGTGGIPGFYGFSFTLSADAGEGHALTIRIDKP